MASADPATGDALRVLIVDDQRSFAESLAVVIDVQAGLECVGVSVTGAEAVAAAAELRADVVLMDVGLPDLDGIEATRRIRATTPSVRVVVLTGRTDATVLARAARVGAAAFLLKDASVEEIIEAVRAEPSQRLGIQPSAIDAILDPTRSVPSGVLELTLRELEVLGELARGHQPKRIARTLGVTVPTCRGYVKSLSQKLGAHTALEAVVLAVRYGVLRLPDQETD